ncbi:MAG: DNA polymerase [Alphaproteobacteria bacterium]|nr:DNA polymerase [Alphaproteobacteria bacterium]
MRYLYQDTETYCEIPIKNGLHRYAEGVEVTIFAYAFDDEPVTVLDLANGDTLPEELIEAQTDPDIIKVFHNSQFDRTVIRHALGINIPVAQIHDTMIQALAHGLPGALGSLCEVFRLDADEAKDKRGRDLISLFCKPRPKNQKLRRATKETHPEQWQEFLDYAGNDIKAMRALLKKMPKWNYEVPYADRSLVISPGMKEHHLWQLDQRINDHGFKVDTELAETAIKAIHVAQKKLAHRTDELTHGDVDKATRRDKLLKHICEYYHVDLPDFKKDTLERRINDVELPWAVRELLAIRLETATTSTGKYKKLLECVSSDGCLRGTLQFDGASRTRRWAGRLFQPQNLPRMILEAIAQFYDIDKSEVRGKHIIEYIESGIDALKGGYADLFFPNVMALCANCIRGVIVARDQKKLCVSDLSNIEGRAQAWLAGEEWKLQAFRDYDAGTGPDLYKISYARAFNIEPEEVDGGEKSGPQRQIGKVLELMLGYEGGVGAFITGAATYKIDLDELAEIAWPLIPDDVRLEAQGFWDWTKKNRRSTFGLDQKTFMTCDALKRLWRRAHPAISSYWPELHKAVVKAVENKGQPVQCRKVTIICKGAWLRIILPSGNCLCYASPKIEGTKITYMGLSPYSRQWKRISTYGGKLLENLCQTISRDIMAANMPAIYDAGYDILLSVHDELITEAPDHEEWNTAHLSGLLATNPEWAPDFPLDAGGFEARRYKKD